MCKVYWLKTYKEGEGYITCAYGYEQFTEIVKRLKKAGKEYETWVTEKEPEIGIVW